VDYLYNVGRIIFKGEELLKKGGRIILMGEGYLKLGGRSYFKLHAS